MGGGKIYIFQILLIFGGFGVGGVPGGSWSLWLRPDKVWAQTDTPDPGSYQIPCFLPILGALGPGPWALVDTSCRSQLDMDLDISALGFDRISIHKMGGWLKGSQKAFKRGLKTEFLKVWLGKS